MKKFIYLSICMVASADAMWCLGLTTQQKKAHTIALESKYALAHKKKTLIEDPHNCGCNAKKCLAEKSVKLRASQYNESLSQSRTVFCTKQKEKELPSIAKRAQKDTSTSYSSSSEQSESLFCESIPDF